MNKNDDTILALKKRIEEKKAEIGSIKRFAPKTSCSITLDGVKYNLHVLSKHELGYVLCKLRALQLAGREYGLPFNLEISGFLIDDWIDDIREKLIAMDQRDKAAQLQGMEKTLDDLLSSDKKTELQIEEIAKLLN